MGSSFNPLILADKLSKLNSSQQSIETLSHWCIFHMNKAKQVVETWARQFHCAPREQRLAFLYLANDILQNSRRKGVEFVVEFWKVLPDSLRDVIENGDEFGRKSAMRLVSIWEERKVFGSRGQLLKEEFVERKSDNSNRNSKHAFGNAVDKLVSGYQAVYNSQSNEDAVFNKCRNAISFIEKVDKDIEGDYDLSTADELKQQHAVLRDCIEHLAAVESSRANLVSLLRDALEDQVHKLDQVRVQLQAAQAHLGDQFPDKPEDTKSAAAAMASKLAAAAMASKLAASTSSAQMLTFVLSSLASEGVIGNEYPSEKRCKIESEYVPQSSELADRKPPPPSSPPPVPPPVQMFPVPQYMQTAMVGPYGYSVGPQPGYSGGPPADSYQGYEAGSGFYEQASSLPVSRQ